MGKKLQKTYGDITFNKTARRRMTLGMIRINRSTLQSDFQKNDTLSNNAQHNGTQE